jgi:hypothetical protein
VERKNNSMPKYTGNTVRNMIGEWLRSKPVFLITKQFSKNQNNRFNGPTKFNSHLKKKKTSGTQLRTHIEFKTVKCDNFWLDLRKMSLKRKTTT